MNAVSTFAGIGGFDLALRRAGVTVTHAVEIDPACRTVLGHHFPGTELHDDIRTFDGTALAGTVDLIAGGFPCQDLSVAGARAGLDGARSGLFFDLMRVVAETRPRWVIFENVPGLLSSNDGRDMGAVLGALGDLGYGWAYRVLDAQHFGVPQRRRRVFIVGCAGNRAAPVQVLFEPEGGGGHPAPRRTPGQVVTALTRNGTGGGGADDSNAQDGHLIAATLTSGPTSKPGVNAPGRRQEDDTNLVTHALTSEGADASEDGTGRGTPLVAYIDGFNHTETAAAGTLDIAGGRHRGVRVDTAVRRLTPTECARLQGFPDDWLDGLGLSDSVKYRMLGNAVAVPVVEWIVRRLVSLQPVGETPTATEGTHL